MAKMKKKSTSDDCAFAIFPVGPGLPLCTYNAVKNNVLSTTKLQDFPICLYKGKCYKELDNKEEKP